MKTNIVHQAMFDEVVDQRNALRARVAELEKALEGVPAELIKAIHYQEALRVYAAMNYPMNEVATQALNRK